MPITTRVSFVTKDQRAQLIHCMQSSLERMGFEQAQIDEIIAVACDSRLCDLQEIIPLKLVKKIVRINYHNTGY